jgi:hypothetical protein
MSEGSVSSSKTFEVMETFGILTCAILRARDDDRMWWAVLVADIPAPAHGVMPDTSFVVDGTTYVTYSVLREFPSHRDLLLTYEVASGEKVIVFASDVS